MEVKEQWLNKKKRGSVWRVKVLWAGKKRMEVCRVKVLSMRVKKEGRI